MANVNTLIGCGGTGAHVALALTRLHALGDPLGLFRTRMGGHPIDLPTLYLVDQDYGDGPAPENPTAWQTLRRVIDHHPAHGGPDRRWPTPREVSPLPVLATKDFMSDGMTSLASRYPNSDYLKCVFSPSQRNIEFSRGMMASPAVGSLLFKLKSYDTTSDDPEINNDQVYHDLLNVTDRVAVVGSGMGGTGAAVGPTLAEVLSTDTDNDRQVMAVMLLNWFEFDELHEHLGDNRLRAQKRNKVMQENAHSGLRYYGKRLVEYAATVPVGVPALAMESRLYSGDNHQPMLEAYPHAVAAICCLRQFLDNEAYSNGLYYLGAEDPSRLGAGTGLPGGRTIRDLAAGAKAFESMLAIYHGVLRSSESRFVHPMLCERLGDRRREVADELGKIRRSYAAHLRWLVGLLKHDVPPATAGSFAREVAIRERLNENHFAFSLDHAPDRIASNLFYWLGEWVGAKTHSSAPASPTGVYWPEMFEDQGLTPSPRQSGALRKVPKTDVQATLDSFVDKDMLAQNGWPHPLAAVRFFRDAITDGNARASRQLELLLLGLFVGDLELRETARRDKRHVSIDTVVDEHRRNGEGADLLGHALIRRGGNQEVMGFTAPATLFCPAPGVSDSEWGALWASLTGGRSVDWQSTGDGEWGSAASSVAIIRGWIEACKRQWPSETPPPWTRCFAAVDPRAGHGGGTEVEVLWSGAGLVRVFLPTRYEGTLPPNALELPRADVQAFLRDCGRVTAGSRTFWNFKFEIADDGEVHGWWDDHLRYLQEIDQIVFFGEDVERRRVHVVVSGGAGEYRLISLSDTLVLRRADIGIRSCTPMNQENVPGGDTPSGKLFPDYPIRWRYFDLVVPNESENQASVLDVLNNGLTLAKPPQPLIDEGDLQATWEVRLRGRTDSVPFVVKCQESHRAHWMVWPRFFAPDWRAYYVYQDCTDKRVRIDALWLNREQSRMALSRTTALDNRSYPIRFSEHERRHAGGPPAALCARRGDEEIGLYLVPLTRVAIAASPIQIGIDFGTSHTTASVKVGDHPAEVVDLAPELSAHARNRISVHVSEDLMHVDASHPARGLLIQGGIWYPRYVKKSPRHLVGLWPSEIHTIEKFATLYEHNKKIETWHPIRDYAIPPAGGLRRELPSHRISNFKWSTASMQLRDKESQLQKIFLDRVVEQALADAFNRYGLPNNAVNLTFTYPLRTPPRDVREYQRTLERVVEDCSASLGCQLALHNGIGLFDESSAARVGTGQFGDVSIVGDLGGGTLDVIISAVGNRFDTAADSVKVGGNLLLDLISESDGLLPSKWGADSEARLANLKAWVRTKGMTALFGVSSERIRGCGELGVQGFYDSAIPRRVRRIIRRYFFLVSEFMARSLAAYLATHWFPHVTSEERNRLRIRVYLRGNGWKLWHEAKAYAEIGISVQERVMHAVERLWSTIDCDFDLPGQNRWMTDHHRSGQGDRAKMDVVNHVVGQSEDPDTVRGKWFSYTLVQLGKTGRHGKQEIIEWYERIPVRTGGEETSIEFSQICPGLPISSMEALVPEVITQLPVDVTEGINRRLQDERELVGEAELDFQAAIAAWVWEEVLQCEVVDPSSKR